MDNPARSLISDIYRPVSQTHGATLAAHLQPGIHLTGSKVKRVTSLTSDVYIRSLCVTTMFKQYNRGRVRVTCIMF